LDALQALEAKGHRLVYVGDVVGTGSSRKSATNSVSATPEKSLYKSRQKKFAVQKNSLYIFQNSLYIFPTAWG
jgi:aconitase B